MKLLARLCLILGLFSLSLSAQTLRIYHIDVEQGDATLIVTPSGKALLVDSGNDGHGGRIKAVMDQAGVKQIDAFVNTHYHKDHYGGIDDLVHLGVPVLKSYDRGDKNFLRADKPNEDTFQDYQRAVGEDAISLRRGMTIAVDPAMTVTCISSGGVVVGEVDPNPGIDENDMSISLFIAFGTFKYFIGGDIEKPTEAKIAARDLVQNVDVYHSDHHGSDTSSSRPFVEDLAPRVIIISNGNHGVYKHPRQVTLDLYASLPGPPTVFQTNKYLKGGAGGNVPDAFIADPESTDSDGTILVTVDAGAGTYTVSYGSSTSRTFSIKGGSALGATMVIESLLPDPVGPDEQSEEVTLKNKATRAISLSGWTLRDRSGRTWALTGLGTLAPGNSKTIKRNGMPMSLNNAGDEIELLDAGNSVHDKFEYTGSTEGVAIQTGH
jgi:competence protein ComEC